MGITIWETPGSGMARPGANSNQQSGLPGGLAAVWPTMPRTRKLSSLVAGMALGAGTAIALAQAKPTRDLLLKIKDPGEGPTPEQRARSWFKVIMRARADGRQVKTETSGGDPGYGETSKMLQYFIHSVRPCWSARAE